MQRSKLSKSDSNVLAQVFDPESSPNRVEVLIDPELPPDRRVHDNLLLDELRSRERNAIAVIEHCEKTAAHAQSRDTAYQTALATLDQIVVERPDYASARNNRAQVRRWRFGDRGMLCQQQCRTDEDRRTAAAAIVEDLKASISLACPDRPQDAISPSQGRLLAQSYTQLGAVYYAASKDLEDKPGTSGVEVDGIMWAREQLEDEASRLFYLGGLYGNEVAKAVAVHTNPHAKLCGNIVREAMKKEVASMQA